MPLSQSEQKLQIRNLISAPLKEGDTWYVVATEWYSIWEQYVDNEDSAMNPGPIKNDSIISIENPSQLKENLLEQQDYVLLPQKAYDILFEYYGGGPPLPRKVISVGSSHAALQIEIYPILVNIYTCVDNMNNETVTSTTTTSTTTSTITGSVCNTPLMKYYMSVKDFINDVLSLLFADHSKYSKEEGDVRIWIRIPDEDQDSFNTNNSSNGNSNNNNDESNTATTTSSATSTTIAVTGSIITDDDKKATTTITTTTTTTTSSSHSTSEDVNITSNNDDISNNNSNTINNNDNNNSTLLTSKSYQQSLQQQQQQLTTLPLLTGNKLTTDKTDVDTEGGYWRFFRLDRTTTTLSTILGGFKILDLLVEVEVKSADGTLEYPRSHILNKWRQSLKVGDIVDAIDNENKWYEAQILSISSTDGSIKIHYFGWLPKFDTIVLEHEINRMIQPLYSHSRNWRVELEVDDKVEVRIIETSTKEISKWFQGTITKVNDINNTIEVLITDRDMKKVYNIYSEDICPMYTHIKKPTNITSNTSSKSTALALSTNSTTSTSTSLVSNLYTPLGSSSARGSTSTSSWHSSRSHVRGKTPVKGAVGLTNLGNTCFMASMLQCLSNTKILTEIFLSEEYKKDINISNPLGKGGKIANVYAKLLRDMWSDQYSVVVPDDFKHIIGEFASQFAGYQQQDSQEFMCFLLDGLHEDLNRITNKISTNAIESRNRDDNIVARESWRRYLLRNDSILVDSCFGLSKSHVTCTGCGNVSVTFEPFNNLSLPIPVTNTRKLTVTLFPLPLGSPPLEFILELPVTDTIKQMKEAIIKTMNGRLQSQSQRLQLQLDNNNANNNESNNSFTTTTTNNNSTASEPIETPISTLTTTTTVNMEESDDSVEVVNMSDAEPSMDVDVEVEVEADNDSPSSFVMVDKNDIMTGVEDKELENSDDITRSTAIQPTITTATTATTTSSSNITDIDTTTNNEDNSDDMINNKLKHQKYSNDQEKSNTTNKTSTSHSNSTTADNDIHLLVCSTYMRDTYPRPSRCFNDNNCIQDIQKHETILIYQLNNFVPFVPTPNYYSTQHTKKFPSSIYVDVQMCYWDVYKASYGTHVHTTLKLIAPVHRISIILDDETDNVKPTTKREIHDQLWELNKAAITSTSTYNSFENKPYELYVLSHIPTTMQILSQKEPLSYDDEPISINNGDILMCVWKTEAYHDDHYDSSAFDRVHIPGNCEGSSSSNSTSTDGTRSLSLLSCFDKYMEREQLAPEQTIYCSKCKQHLAPLKKMDIWTAPEILILHLKRFQHIPGQYMVHRDKITDLVDFPIVGLDLSSYIKGENHGVTAGSGTGSGSNSNVPPALYDLYGVSEHSGGLGGGHYTAVCKNFVDEKWYSFNDSHVSEVNPEEAVTPRAYVLFYQRREHHHDNPSTTATNNSVQHWRWGGLNLDTPTGLENEIE